MHHPNIIALKESYDTKGGRKNIVMEHADGSSIEDEIKDRQMVTRLQNVPLELFAEDQILSWFVQMCLGLKYVHERKVLHRDIKPANVFKTKSGIIKFGDFGVSKLLSSTLAKASTEIGTPLYLSPEIVNGQKYDAATDIWSLGVTLYELCTLKRPFDTQEGLIDLNEKIKKGKYEEISD